MASGLLMAAFGCSSNGNSSDSASPASLAGNWQFTMSSPPDNSFIGGIIGGFLQQSQQSVTGAVAYSISLPPGPPVSVACNSGSASVTGTVNGQAVMITVQAGGQTFTLTGTLSADGSTLMGTYSSTTGVQVNGVACGTAQSNLPWSAIAVPPLSGAVQGFFHSMTTNQDLPVTGVLTQGKNIGATNATVTGSLTFQGYSCLGGPAAQTISVNGGISGQYVVMQLFNEAGVNIGQVGQSLFGQSVLEVNANPTLYQSVSGGYVVRNTNVQAGYGGYYVTTTACTPSDYGNLCLAVGSGNSTTCTQPILLSPASLTFPTQLVGSTPTNQTITLTNTDPSGAALTGLSLSFNPGSGVAGDSDFNGLPSFLEMDSCAPSLGSPFSLQSQQSCTITVSFSPQQSCPWVPISGAPAAQCPPFGKFAVGGLGVALTVNSPTSADSDKTFSVPISGTGQSAAIPSTPELDFGSEATGESSPPQALSFANTGLIPVQILGKANSQNACSPSGVTLAPPLQAGSADGLRVVRGPAGITETGQPQLTYSCDIDATSKQANFQLSSDSCTGALLNPGDVCTVTMTYVPQPATPNIFGLDYFLELNTLQCALTQSMAQPNCEIDSGRFPVEIRANPASPLRMSPAAGLDFAAQGKGTKSAPLAITLTNDPQDPHAGIVNFQGNVVTGNFTETDNCGFSLAPGNSCTLNIVFAPASTGFQQGTIAINNTVPSQPLLASPQVQTIRLRGVGQ